MLATLLSVVTCVNIYAQSSTTHQDSLLNQLKEVESLQDWVNDNLFPGMFDSENPVPMMVFTDNSVLTFNPDTTLLSIFHPKETGLQYRRGLFRRDSSVGLLSETVNYLFAHIE